ncbi:MAG: ATP-binding cassette domain-containing protein [Dehalococcoidia bacterium]|nr:ATP-binding cassette domain-containing protein [Dehalococcoidia bacterium]
METRLTSAPKLSLRGVIVRRAGHVVLDVPALDVAAGEALAIIGPNGAGKTTLLLQLALLERAAAGQVLFEGGPAHGRELSLRRRMAVVFQQPLLLDRSVRSNVEAGLRLRGVRKGERRARARHWLARFGVEPLADRDAHALSGGEAQRVSLARAFALDPEVLLLDEPFSALDQPTRAALTEDLAAVLADTPLTSVLVTHDHDEAARLGDRVAVLIGGRIRQAGTPAEVFGAPADAAVAAFVGVQTMFDATVASRAGGIVVLQAGPHRIDAVDDGGAFARALVCLRPEDVGVTRVDVSASSMRNRIPARVRQITTTGAAARVELDCGFPLVAQITRRSLDDLGLDAGMEVVASFKATAVHLIAKA